MPPLFPSRKLCLSLLLLCPLACILPISFFFLLHSSSPATLILHEPQRPNITAALNAYGFAGPIKVFGNRELRTVRRIHDEWGSLWPKLRDKLMARGFLEPSERTCFIWLVDCYALANHPRMLNIVTSVIGPKVLLYGVTVWQGRNELLQRFHKDREAAGCNKCLNVVLGTDVQVIAQSHKLAGRVFDIMMRALQTVEEESLKFIHPHERAAFLERSFAARVKRMVRTPDVRLASLQGVDGEAVFFPGGATYRVGEVLGGRIALLLQFVSADCKVRDVREFQWGSHGMQKSIYMPPTLLVAGDRGSLSISNDVRLGLVRDEEWKAGTEGRVLEGGELLFGHENQTAVENVMVFPEWNEENGSVMRGGGRIEKFVVARKEAVEFGQTVEFEQVMVVLRERILYWRAINDMDIKFCELWELLPGSAMRLSKNLLHAIVPSGEAPTATLIDIRWQNSESILAEAVEGRTIRLNSGQAYDPDNDDNCDVIVIIVEGALLQILPSNSTAQASDILIIPAAQSCVLWNIGAPPVRFFAMHLCRLADDPNGVDPAILSSFGSGGKVF